MRHPPTVAALTDQRSDLAVQMLEKAVQLDPANPTPRLYLGRAYRALGREVDGRRELEQAEQLVKNQP